MCDAVEQGRTLQFTNPDSGDLSRLALHTSGVSPSLLHVGSLLDGHVVADSSSVDPALFDHEDVADCGASNSALGASSGAFFDAGGDNMRGLVSSGELADDGCLMGPVTPATPADVLHSCTVEVVIIANANIVKLMSMSSINRNMIELVDTYSMESNS